MKKISLILLAVVVLFIGIQLIPYGKDHTNPRVVSEPQWDSPKTRATFIRLCGDCHSHETVWPKYSNFAPVSWLVQHDVEAGRTHLNISLWGVQDKNYGVDAANEYEKGEMPPWIYTLPRPENKLSQKEKEEFIKGLKATFNSSK